MENKIWNFQRRALNPVLYAGISVELIQMFAFLWQSNYETFNLMNFLFLLNLIGWSMVVKWNVRKSSGKTV